MADTVCRELTPDEQEAAVALWELAGLTRPWNDPRQDYARAVDGTGSAVLGILCGGSLDGTVMVGCDGHRGWVYYLAVRPGAEDQGIGRTLMQAAEAWLVDRSVPKLNLMVRHDNLRALGFYDLLGYEPDEVVVLSRWLT